MATGNDDNNVNGVGMTGVEVDDDGNIATRVDDNDDDDGNDDGDGDGTTGNEVDNDGDSTMGNKVDNDCDGATGNNNNDNDDGDDDDDGELRWRDGQRRDEIQRR